MSGSATFAPAFERERHFRNDGTSGVSRREDEVGDAKRHSGRREGRKGKTKFSTKSFGGSGKVLTFAATSSTREARRVL